MKKCFEFYFSFPNWDNPQIVDDMIYIIPLHTNEITMEQEEKLLKLCDEKKLEHYPYGVHDIAFGSILYAKDDEYESIFGFGTYEVSKDKAIELMNIWKNIFSIELNIQTDDILVATY